MPLALDLSETDCPMATYGYARVSTIDAGRDSESLESL
jgi:hypothetical protein